MTRTTTNSAAPPAKVRSPVEEPCKEPYGQEDGNLTVRLNRGHAQARPVDSAASIAAKAPLERPEPLPSQSTLLFERPAPGHRALLVSVRFARSYHDHGDAHRDEFEELVRSAGLVVAQTVTASRQAPHPRWFVGTGKLGELKAAIPRSEATVVVFNHDLAPAQQRNLERSLACRVMTRTELILHIFADRARTHEGKLQVELAQLTHAQTRLVRGWTHLDRQTGVGGAGGRGASGRIGGAVQRGAGETQLEMDQRMLAIRVRQVRARLDGVHRRRALNRRRRSRADVPTVALCGYTNAGKSTLFNALTGSDVLAGDRLFATLDPTMHRLADCAADIVLADTVGFVRALPVTLVDAFRATLEEVTQADLILHVIDASAPDADDLRQAVGVFLREIGATPEAGVPMIEVLNKVDLVVGGAPAALDEARVSGDVERIAVSALTGEGLSDLRAQVCARLGLDAVTTEVRLSAGDGKSRAWLFRHGTVEQETIEADGQVTVRVRLDRSKLGQLPGSPG